MILIAGARHLEQFPHSQHFQWKLRYSEPAFVQILPVVSVMLIALEPVIIKILHIQD